MCTILSIVGTVMIVLGIIDFAGIYIGYDMTGVFWTPIAFIASGILFRLICDYLERRDAHFADEKERKTG